MYGASCVQALPSFKVLPVSYPEFIFEVVLLPQPELVLITWLYQPFSKLRASFIDSVEIESILLLKDTSLSLVS